MKVDRNLLKCDRCGRAIYSLARFRECSWCNRGKMKFVCKESQEFKKRK